jgi:hypothetical protein
MCTADRKHIGLRVVQEMVNELRDLLAIADEWGKVRGELPYDACSVNDRRACGREYVVKDVVDRVSEAILSHVEDLRQLYSEFRRFCGVEGKCFGLVVQTCVANGGEEVLGLCQQ